MDKEIRADKVEARDIAFLWAERIPRGMLTLMAGRPGEGKSMFTAYLAAEVTKKRGKVIFSNMEDPLAQVVRPRLEAAGAVLERVYFWNPVLPGDTAELEAKIKELRASLVILDPIAAHLSVSIYNDQEARAALSPLSAVLSRTQASVLAVHHTVKNTSSSGHPLRAVGGSGGGLAGAARAVFVWGVNPHDGDERVLVPIKYNIADMPKTAHFEMDEEEIVVGKGAKSKLMQTGRLLYLQQATVAVDPWTVINHTATGINHTNIDKRAEAAEWLTKYLAFGKRPATEIKEDAVQNGLSWRTVRRAQELIEIQIVREKTGKQGGKSFWQLPVGHPALILDVSDGDEAGGDEAAEV